MVLGMQVYGEQHGSGIIYPAVPDHHGVSILNTSVMDIMMYHNMGQML